MILSALLAATILLVDTTPAAAAAATAVTPATPASADAAKKPEEGRLVCHSESQPGTLMTKKVCQRVVDSKKSADKPTPSGN